MKSYHLIFTSTLIGGTLLAISANSWFTSWLGLEINLMSIAPLILLKINKPLVEATLKYFLIQALASTILIIRVNLILTYSAGLKIDSIELLVFISLLLKAGIPPLHFWFPSIISNLHWPQCFILFSWQKVAPLLLMSCFKISKIIVSIRLTVAIGALGGLNQLLTKTLITYSSIAHRGWLLAAARLSLINWLFYFLIYCILSASIIFLAWKFPIKTISQITKWQASQTNKYLFLFNILSLGGLPPFLGFLAKLSIIIYLTHAVINILLLWIITFSLVSLFYYFRLVHSFTLKKNSHAPQLPDISNKFNNTLIFSSISLNILTPFMRALL